MQIYKTQLRARDMEPAKKRKKLRIFEEKQKLSGEFTSLFSSDVWSKRSSSEIEERS